MLEKNTGPARRRIFEEADPEQNVEKADGEERLGAGVESAVKGPPAALDRHQDKKAQRRRGLHPGGHRQRTRLAAAGIWRR